MGPYLQLVGAYLVPSLKEHTSVAAVGVFCSLLGPGEVVQTILWLAVGWGKAEVHVTWLQKRRDYCYSLRIHTPP